MTEPKPTDDDLPAVLVHDATPAMADVLSGSTHRPEPPAPGDDIFRWAMNTHALLRAVMYIAGDRRVDLATVMLAQPGEDSDDDNVALAREMFGEPDACVLAMVNQSECWLIALNEDGTRACTVQLDADTELLYDAVHDDDDDLPPELDYDQLAEIARAWPWNVRDALARTVAHAEAAAGVDRAARRKVQHRLAVLFGEIDE